jgi:hypothetical protein
MACNPFSTGASWAQIREIVKNEKINNENINFFIGVEILVTLFHH